MFLTTPVSLGHSHVRNNKAMSVLSVCAGMWVQMSVSAGVTVRGLVRTSFTSVTPEDTVQFLTE